jgi:hypothetical protein
MLISVSKVEKEKVNLKVNECSICLKLYMIYLVGWRGRLHQLEARWNHGLPNQR